MSVHAEDLAPVGPTIGRPPLRSYTMRRLSTLRCPGRRIGLSRARPSRREWDAFASPSGEVVPCCPQSGTGRGVMASELKPTKDPGGAGSDSGVSMDIRTAPPSLP